MPKSYSQYKYQDIETLGIEFKKSNFITSISPVNPSELLLNILKSNQLLSLNTEKAKSEFLIAPVLGEFAQKNNDLISFFSGYSLDINKSLGLKGFCDFIFTKTPYQPIIKEPIFCVVEAKNDNLENGVPQCIAEMYGSILFNQQNNKPITTIYGCVTTGYTWQFLKLENNKAYQDTTIYSLGELPQILGILQFIVES